MPIAVAGPVSFSQLRNEFNPEQTSGAVKFSDYYNHRTKNCLYVPGIQSTIGAAINAGSFRGKSAVYSYSANQLAQIIEVPTKYSSISIVCVGKGGNGFINSSDQGYGGGGGSLVWIKNLTVPEAGPKVISMSSSSSTAQVLNYLGTVQYALLTGKEGTNASLSTNTFPGGTYVAATDITINTPTSLGPVTFNAKGGGSGGQGGPLNSSVEGGGGGAGGYTGNGGNGQNGSGGVTNPTAGSGGGGGGGGKYRGGGGVGVFGAGQSGTANTDQPGGGGSGGESGKLGDDGVESIGGNYGGGGSYNGLGGAGIINVMWGPLNTSFSPVLSSFTITSSAQNINLYNWLLSNGWTANYGPVTVTIANGVVIGSSSRTTPAMTIDTQFTVNVTLVVANGAYLVGAGGNGGKNGSSALSGGVALRILKNNTTVTINSGGTIGGGGGGGGELLVTTIRSTLYQGGGGAGNIVGTGGTSGTNIIASGSGTLTTGGAGAVLTTGVSQGGNGGGLGQKGENAIYGGAANYTAYPGQPAGAAISKAVGVNITLNNNGSLLGSEITV